MLISKRTNNGPRSLNDSNLVSSGSHLYERVNLTFNISQGLRASVSAIDVPYHILRFVVNEHSQYVSCFNVVKSGVVGRWIDTQDFSIVDRSILAIEIQHLRAITVDTVLAHFVLRHDSKRYHPVESFDDLYLKVLYAILGYSLEAGEHLYLI